MVESVELYEIPKLFERADTMGDDVLPVYLESINSYNNPRAREALGKFRGHDGELIESNPFMAVHFINKVLPQLQPGKRLATRADIETAIKIKPSFAEGRYIDFGVSLVTAGDSYKPNGLLAKIAAEDLTQRGIPLNAGRLVDLNALALEEHDNSAYGLVFRLKDSATNENVRDLSEFKWKYGPKKEGLSRAFLGSYRYWDPTYYLLGYSNSDGRVVLVSAEGTSQNFLDELNARFEEQRKRLESELETRNKLQSSLRGE